jgi:hypothetical protein
MGRPLIERIWEKIDVRDPDECWLWTGSKDQKGYGQYGGFRVTRVILGLAKGEKIFARHKCDNPPCCNPANAIALAHEQGYLWAGDPRIPGQCTVVNSSEVSQ